MGGRRTRQDAGSCRPPMEPRYWVAVLLCIANAICYADRTNIGIAVPYFVPDAGDRGVVLSAFFYGYMLTQIAAGSLAKKMGVKTVLGVGVIVWTICDMATILVSDSLVLLFLVRACMGCGEGVVMPSLHRFATNWFPARERSTLVALVSSGSDLGTIASLFVSPWILKVTGGQWKYIFLVFGGFSALWLWLYSKHVTSKPEEHPSHTSKEEPEEEEEFLRSTSSLSSGSLSRQQEDPSQSIPWKTLLTSKQLWVIYTAHFSFNYSWYVLLGWLPTYLHDHLGLDLKENQILAATPYFCGYIGLLVSGRVSDLLIARGVRTLHVRRLVNSLSSFLPALCLYRLAFAKEPTEALWLLSAALFFGRASTVGFWIHMIDVGPDYAGNTMGISNTIATVPGILGNLLTGFLLQQTHSWTMVFHIAALVSVVGGVVFGCCSRDENVFDRNQKRDEDGEEVVGQNQSQTFRRKNTLRV